MVDVWIRDLPADVVFALDVQAARLGIPRDEFIRRELGQVRRRQGPRVEVADLRRFAALFSDLSNPAVADRAWH